LEFGSVGVPLSAEIERETIQRAREGDQQALANIYDMYLPRIYRYVYLRVGDVTEAEDLTEDIFLRMLSGIADYKQGGVPFSAWLFRIAHNHLVSHYRKNGVRGPKTTIDENVVDSRPDPATIVETRLTYGEVAKAVEELPEAQREVISLRFAVGLSIAETAKALGKRQGNVKALQHKAVAKLQRMLRAGPEVRTGI
jgi:RNA polymerase sigma-70 factor (ECF subfamily)